MYRADVVRIVSGTDTALRSLTDGRARPNIFAAGHVRIVSFRDLCDRHHAARHRPFASRREECFTRAHVTRVSR